MLKPHEKELVCDCTKCSAKCLHQDAYRRLPKESGGLGLCVNLYKEVYDLDTLEELKKGDFVRESVIDSFIDMLPPVTMSNSLVQTGEAYAHYEDPDTGFYKAVYNTYIRITPGNDGIWAFCGYCFRGEYVERGIKPSDV